MIAAERAWFERLGSDLVRYLLNLTDEQLERFYGRSAAALSSEQEEVLEELLLLDTQVGLESEGWTLFSWRSTLGRWREDAGMSLGNLARRRSGGLISVPPTGLTEIDETLATLAIDSYPTLLLKHDDDGWGPSVSLSGNPAEQKFIRSIREDSLLGRLFGEEHPIRGRGGSTLRSTGAGGTHSLVGFAETLIGSGWRLALTRKRSPGVADLVEATQHSIDTIRSALTGDSTRVPANFGLAGVLFPASLDVLDFGWGRMRKSGRRDAVFVRSTSLEGQLTSLVSDGLGVAINYSGDVVLEAAVPYLVRTAKFDASLDWSKELDVGQRSVEEYVNIVRLGLLLAVPEVRPVLAPSWQLILDPFSQGVGVSWFDVKNVPGLFPFQLTESQARDWAMWVGRISELRTPSVDIAIRRMVMAVSERQRPDDMLLDAVIVWESLFGSNTDTSLRITSSLAWLLGSSPEDRLLKQAHYRKIYGARPDSCHLLARGGSVGL